MGIAVAAGRDWLRRSIPVLLHSVGVLLRMDVVDEMLRAVRESTSEARKVFREHVDDYGELLRRTVLSDIIFWGS